MKGFRFLLLVLITFSACKTTRYVPPAVNNTRSEYIRTYGEFAISEMKRTGIPASIKMAQAILESGDGNSRLARQANNHFGIKCHEWTGRKIYHDDDHRNECFRSYNNPLESFRDHSEFLTGRARYAGLFKLDPLDYKAWARGLKAAGYATNPEYDRLLIRIIEDNHLYRLDSGLAFSRLDKDATAATNIPAGPVATRQFEVLQNNRIRYMIARESDSYESITEQMEFMRWELDRYNDLSGIRVINPGDIVYLQPKRNRAQRGYDVHVAEEGDTMHLISQMYGIRLSRLLSRNYMEEGQEPSPGTYIFLRWQPPRENPGLR
jgi:hypothetical protein